MGLSNDAYIHNDIISRGKTRTRRHFCSFYTESDPILTYMVSKLNVKNDDIILEPCAGDGIFIEKLLETYDGREFRVEAIDLNASAVNALRQNFADYTNVVSIRHADTLLDDKLDLLCTKNGHYTKIIGNPPYGAWQDYSRRDVLKRKYKGYVKETYTLFLERCVDLLRPEGKLVFIVPDTFLALHLHKHVRKRLLTETSIEELLLIPTKFFPGVNFGYSNLCIITFKKTTVNEKNKIKVVSVKQNIDSLYEIANGNYKSAYYQYDLMQQEVLNSLDYSFLLSSDKKIRTLINSARVTLADIADCVTGFYSGDNKRFLAVSKTLDRYGKDLPRVDNNSIDYDYLKRDNLLNGLTNGKRYVPIIKGGRGIIEKETDVFVLWDAETISFYKRDKKARFQNASYYFREGIGVPMVKTKKINAFILENRLFDQSIVGVFPKQSRYLNYLLAFLNSDTCNLLLNTINHTANNSANYLKKLPIIVNDRLVSTTKQLIDRYLNGENKQKVLEEINQLFCSVYGF